MAKEASEDKQLVALFGSFAGSVRTATDVGTLRAALIDYLTRFGVKMISYHHLPPPGALDHTPQVTVAAIGFPKAWVERYIAEEFFNIDPIPKRAMRATQNFFWSDAAKFEGLTDDERFYLSQLQLANLGDGLAIPVFGPRGRCGYVGLGFGPDGKRPTAGEVTLMQSACQLGHQSYCALLFAGLPDATRLSPREIEILNWVARGKSNAVIAQILDISLHTVDTHLRRVFAKLGVQDRVTAALRGAARGLL